MLRFYTTTLFIVLGIFAAFAQNSQFKEDAIQLAARLAEESQSDIISKELITSVENALVAISTSPSPAANAVIHKYAIHPLETSNVKNAMIVVDKNASWIGDLSQTPVHDVIPQSEGIKLVQKEATDDYVLLELSYKEPANMKFIANEISVVDDVWMVEVPTKKQDGSDINIRKIGDSYLFTFAYKFNGCETGCEDAHFWEFSVNKKGEVEFLNEYGSDLKDLKDDDHFTVIDDMRM